jgi:hypothetical protein
MKNEKEKQAETEVKKWLQESPMKLSFSVKEQIGRISIFNHSH